MDIKMNVKIKKILVLLLIVFVFGLFWRITTYTPLAGDDWGYAINGLNSNPFTLAYQFYFSWSGRFFSELWGFIVAQRKWLWNILNPLLFTLIYFYSIKIFAKKEYLITTSLLFLVIMLNVSNQLRMETYTWIMGTTYVVPLLLSLIYFYIVEKYLYLKDRISPWFYFITIILCFYISMTIENIAAVLVFGIVLLIISQYFKERSINKLLVINTIVGLFGFIVMRLSPGSTYRYLNDNATFANMGLFEKIGYNMPNFIQFSFMENKYLISLLSLVFIILLIKRYRIHELSFVKLIIIIVYELLSCIIVFSNILVDKLNLNFFSIFYDYTNPINWIYWIVYVIVAFTLIIKNVEDIKNKEKILFFLLIGGASSVIMLLSPIFGARSVLYFTYYISIVVMLLFNELKIEDGKILMFVSVVSFVLIIKKTDEYLYKYELVSRMQNERMEIIQYYIDNPDIKEVHIPRMPPLTVHSADIEEYDTYHQEVFKKYYGLSEDSKLIFEWKESYK